MKKEKTAIANNSVPAKGQVVNNTFYLGEGGARVLILGNSITLHGPKADIDWHGEWGMAASEREKDYVHLLFDKALAAVKDVSFFTVQASFWENEFWSSDILGRFEEARGFRPDIIIFRLGENIEQDNCDKHSLPEAITRLMEFLSVAGHTKLIFTTCFWRHEKTDKAIEETAERLNANLVNLGDMGNTDAMKALGLFTHNGVAAHPGDEGMEHIADRIWRPLSEMLEKKEI